MYEKFTDRSRKIMQLAAKTAKKRGDFFLGVHHLLIALVEEENSLASSVFKRLNINVKTILIEAATSEPACGTADVVGQILYTPNTKMALDHAEEIAALFGHNYIGTEHLLLGLLKTSHPVVEVLHKAGVNYDNAYDTITSLLTSEKKMLSKEEIAINFYCGVLKRIIKICDENTRDKAVNEVRKIAKRAILDGGKWNIS